MSNTEITNDDVDSYTSQLLEARGTKPGKLIQLLEGTEYRMHTHLFSVFWFVSFDAAFI